MAPQNSLKISDVAGSSRKTTACLACRKQKIKCHLNGSNAPCARCRKRGLSCTVNKSLHVLLENEATWKDSMERRMQRMEEEMKQVTRVPVPERPGNSASQDQSTERIDEDDDPEAGNQVPSNQMSGLSQQPWQVVIDPTCGPGAIPASCVAQAQTPFSMSRVGTGKRGSDIVSQGVITQTLAEQYFDHYHQILDPVVYHILAEHKSLASIRAKSTLLVAVVCAVSALHTTSPDYQIYYQAFRNQFAAQLLSKEQSFDDVRALCIGAFFLSDMSWNLIGAVPSVAVRIASEINLHRCITKIPHVKSSCYIRTRLYFLVYVCDHHFSIAYGRPPMTREFDPLSSPKCFLDSEFASEKDARLISQIEIWSISGRVFDTFGVDSEMTVPEKLLPQFRRLNIALDTWRADWADRFGSNESAGRHPKIDVALHYHFAKLYLCSHAFRGPRVENESHRLSSEMQEFAGLGILLASSIIRAIAGDPEIQTLLSNLPTYFDTMIAFAAVFLLKMTRRSPQNVKIDKEETFGLLQQLVTVLTTVTAGMHTQHLLSCVAASIGSLLQTTRESQAASAVPEGMGPGNEQDWLMPSSDFLSNYDFFWPQDTDLDVDLSGACQMSIPN